MERCYDERPVMARDDADAVWWCPHCSEAFELGESAFTMAMFSEPYCPNDGCGAVLEAA